MTTVDNNLSLDHLRELIATMSDWSMKCRVGDWTAAQMAAWRMRWFGVTPEDDQRRSEDYALQRAHELRNGFDSRELPEHEPFVDWPDGQGAYE